MKVPRVGQNRIRIRAGRRIDGNGWDSRVGRRNTPAITPTMLPVGGSIAPAGSSSRWSPARWSVVVCHRRAVSTFISFRRHMDFCPWCKLFSHFHSLNSHIYSHRALKRKQQKFSGSKTNPFQNTLHKITEYHRKCLLTLIELCNGSNLTRSWNKLDLISIDGITSFPTFAWQDWALAEPSFFKVAVDCKVCHSTNSHDSHTHHHTCQCRSSWNYWSHNRWAYLQLFRNICGFKHKIWRIS